MHTLFSGDPSVNYVLDGQHKYSAVVKCREMMAAQGTVMPKWMTTFHCCRLKPSTSLDDRQKCAGREQAKAATVLEMPLSAHIEWYLRGLKAQLDDVASAVSEGRKAPEVNRTKILRDVYIKCACTIKNDGPVVCTHHYQYISNLFLCHRSPMQRTYSP